MKILWLLVLLWFAPVSWAEVMMVETSEGEEVSVNHYPATLVDADKPLLVWFTEGYASRNAFKQQITWFNDAGFEIWQVDLLESYFIERTPTNVRKLSGEGVAAVLSEAQTYAQKSGKKFVPVSTGRMSLILLRGVRLWQLAEQPENGLGALQQVVLFFPNLYNSPQKAGDSPELFPIVAASRLPITLVQPLEGTYRWKLTELLHALEHSQVAVVTVPKVRDWYFLRRDPDEIERQASGQIAQQFASWLQVGNVGSNQIFMPVEKLAQAQVNHAQKGLVEIAPRAAMDFELIDIAGQSLRLSDKRGKVVLLNFWASWCPPCVKEIPSMNRLAQSFDAEQFEIVSVNFKESPQTIRDFLKQVQVDFPVLMDLDGKVSADYEIFAFPSSFLIDAKGQLRYSVNSAIEWDEVEVKAVIQNMVQAKL